MKLFNSKGVFCGVGKDAPDFNHEDFSFGTSNFSYPDLLKYYQKIFPLLKDFGSYEYFQERLTTIKKKISYSRISGILNGPHLPIIIKIGQGDRILTSCQKLFKRVFPYYNNKFGSSGKRFTFYDFYENEDLSGKDIFSACTLEYNAFLSQSAKEATVALFFPQALAGRSVNEQRKQIVGLKKEMDKNLILSLAGPLEGLASIPLFGGTSRLPQINLSAVDIEKKGIVVITENEYGPRMYFNSDYEKTSANSTGGITIF